MSRRPWRGGALATPYVVGLVLLVAVPAAFSTGLAFSAYDGFAAPRFTGLVAVRPERTRMVSLAEGRFDAQVAAVEPAGEEAVVHLEVLGLWHQVLSRVPFSARPEVGAKVGVTWEVADERHFPDAEDE